MAGVHEQMTQHTRKSIQNTFMTLVQEEGFQNITVKKIAQQAGINRGTFYLHFVDKFEVMEQVQKELLADLHERIDKIAPREAFLAVKQQQLYPPFVAIFQFVSDHATSLRAILGEQGDPSFARKIKQVFGETLGERLIEINPSAKDKEFRQYLLAFLTSAILGVIQEWLDNYEKQTVDEMAKIHFKLLEFISSLGTILMK